MESYSRSDLLHQMILCARAFRQKFWPRQYGKVSSFQDFKSSLLASRSSCRFFFLELHVFLLQFSLETLTYKSYLSPGQRFSGFDIQYSEERFYALRRLCCENRVPVGAPPFHRRTFPWASVTSMPRTA